MTGVSAGYLEFTGSVEQVQRTFAVTIASFGNGDSYANTADPLIPADSPNVIGAVTGMDNMALRRRQPAYQRRFDPECDHRWQSRLSGRMISVLSTMITRAPGSDGSGDCIAIVGTSDFLDSTMSAFTNDSVFPHQLHARTSRR